MRRVIELLSVNRIRQIFKKEPSNRPQRFPNNILVKNETSKTGHNLPKLWNSLPENLKDPTLTIKKIQHTTKRINT